MRPRKPNFSAMERRLREKHQPNLNLTRKFDAALKKHGHEILPILEDIESDVARSEAIEIFSTEADTNEAVRKIIRNRRT